MSGASESPPENPTATGAGAGAAAAAPLTSKKPQPVPWTQQETVHLIQAYQDKWYSLRRGPLKSNQWEEVALNVSLLCGYDYDYPTKSAIQCRHKMEKLRKRYREENRRLSSTPGAVCFWPYYHFMDALERGPLPLAARPIGVGVPLPPNPQSNHHYHHPTTRFNTAVASHTNPFNDGFSSHVFNAQDPDFNNYEEEDDYEDEKEEEVEVEEDYYHGYRGKSRSINYILKKPPPVAVVGRTGEEGRGLNVAAKKRKRDEGEVVGLGCLAGEIRGLVERMIRVEKEKMEMAKETERWRMEMEAKRTEMILDSQRKIVDLIDAAFGSGLGQRELKAEQEF